MQRKIKYAYSKTRKTFGREPLFQSVPAEMLDNIKPDPKMQKNYILRNPIHQHSQVTHSQSERDTNTDRVKTKNRRINHCEGGWPRDVPYDNEELTQRHIRRAVRDDKFTNSISKLTPALTHCIHQNNAIELYETYFQNMETQKPIEQNLVRLANTFKDPCKKYKRPVSSIKWTNEANSNLAVAYCFRTTDEESVGIDNRFCIWDVNNPYAPLHSLYPEKPCWQIECSPEQPQVFLGGLQNGTVHIFDTRDGLKSTASSSIFNSHRNCPVTALLYTHSRTNTEFFSSSTDGQCLWWDMRNLSSPTENIFITTKFSKNDTVTLDSAIGVTALEYNKGLLTKFMCGTESGLIFNVNKAGKSQSDQLNCYWHGHSGIVRAIQRSPCTFRMFLSCGDYRVRIWSEESHLEPIIVSQPYQFEVSDASWSAQRFSSYMAVDAGGKFYYYDLLRNRNDATATLQLSQNELTKLKPHAETELVATGDSAGCTYLLQLSDNMVTSNPEDKAAVNNIYERETKREHILENRVKEIKLKEKTEAEMMEQEQEEIVEEDSDLQEAELEYFRIVKEQTADLEIDKEVYSSKSTLK